jgi:hypothetical protein
LVDHKLDPMACISILITLAALGARPDDLQLTFRSQSAVHIQITVCTV